MPREQMTFGSLYVLKQVVDIEEVEVNRVGLL